MRPPKASCTAKRVGPGVEVGPLQVLERPPRLVVLVAGQVDLAVAGDLAAVRRRPGSACCSGGSPPVGRRWQLGEAQREADAQVAGLVEQRLGVGPGHLGLEEGVDVGLVVEPPAGEERGQGQLGEGHQLGAVGRRLRAAGRSAARPPRPGVSARATGPSWAAATRSSRVMAPVRPPVGSRPGSSSTSSSTLAPASRSSGWVCSAGLWLMPPTLGVKIMPAGHTAASIWASWPAPEGSRRVAEAVIGGHPLDQVDHRRIELGRPAKRARRRQVDLHPLGLGHLRHPGGHGRARRPRARRRRGGAGRRCSVARPATTLTRSGPQRRGAPPCPPGPAWPRPAPARPPRWRAAT